MRLPHRHNRHDSELHLVNHHQRRNTPNHFTRNNQRGTYKTPHTSRPNHHPNQTLVNKKQTCIAVIYCLITSILYLDNILPFLACSILDFLILIGFIVVAIVMGKPLSYLQCTSLAELGYKDATAYSFSSHLDSYIATLSGKIEFQAWIGASRAICLETKAIWGLSIALWLVFSSLALNI